MFNLSESCKSRLFLFAAIVFVMLAIVGGVRGYSPVPFGDMWNGYLGFYVKVANGELSVWWAQHNEHRILLARCFFWLDFVLFSGRGWFLVVVNYLLQSFVCLLLWSIWKESSGGKHNWLGYFIIAWLFWWIQKNNLEWGFQSQFILAQLLPLSAFYFLHRSTETTPQKNNWFLFALVSGCLTIGSMANGVLALPIMTVYAILTRMVISRVLMLGMASVLTLMLYFYGYDAPSGHGSLKDAILTNPLGLLQYVAVYLGGPFAYLEGPLFFGKMQADIWTATIAGGFLIASSVAFTIKTLTSSRAESLRLALLMFMLYIGGTAFGTGGGRLIFGIDQALSSRYMTPALMAWATLLILYLPIIYSLRQSAQSKLWVAFLILIAMMLPSQLQALSSVNARNFDRQVAALAVELGVKDEAQVKNVFPSLSWVFELAEQPIADNLSIFGLSPIKDKRQVMKSHINISNIKNTCQGSIDEVSNVNGDPEYMKVRGWIFDQSQNKVPEYALVVDALGTVYGVFLTGDERVDVANVISPQAEYSRIKGYLLSESLDKTLNIVTPGHGCLMPFVK